MDKLKLLQELMALGEWKGKERCGLVLESGEIIELANTSESNEEFSFDHKHLKTEGAWATWHTHPKGLHNLSGADYNSFLTVPDLRHFVVTDISVMCFKTEFKLLLVIDHDYTDVNRVLK